MSVPLLGFGTGIYKEAKRTSRPILYNFIRADLGELYDDQLISPAARLL